MRKRFKLGDRSPFYKRLDEVFTLMEKNRLSIHIYGDQAIVTDHETKTDYDLCDAEDTSGRGLNDLPPTFEFKLTFEKDVDDE